MLPDPPHPLPTDPSRIPSLSLFTQILAAPPAATDSGDVRRIPPLRSTARCPLTPRHPTIRLNPALAATRACRRPSPMGRVSGVGSGAGGHVVLLSSESPLTTDNTRVPYHWLAGCRSSAILLGILRCRSAECRVPPAGCLALPIACTPCTTDRFTTTAEAWNLIFLDGGGSSLLMVVFTSSSDTRGAGPVGGSTYTFVSVSRFKRYMDDYMGAWKVYCNDDDVPVHGDDNDGCFQF